MTGLNLSNVEFIRSAADAAGFVRDGFPQVIFSGRSNAGKSSLINMLLGRKNAAKVSATPGKTAHVNYFLIDRKVYFVDLPGYGYAKVSKQEKLRWAKLMEDYFGSDSPVKCAVLIVDARHKPTADDVVMFNLLKSMECRVIVACNKLDKISRKEMQPACDLIMQTLGMDIMRDELCVMCSAKDGSGKREILGGILSSLD